MNGHCIHGPGDIYKCGHPDCVGAREFYSRNIIYIVTEGNFSDYAICEVFANRESADKYVEYYNGKYSKRPELKDWWRVEEWELKKELKVDKDFRDCPYPSHVDDCTCQGMGGDR